MSRVAKISTVAVLVFLGIQISLQSLSKPEFTPEKNTRTNFFAQVKTEAPTPEQTPNTLVGVLIQEAQKEKLTPEQAEVVRLPRKEFFSVPLPNPEDNGKILEATRRILWKDEQSVIRETVVQEDGAQVIRILEKITNEGTENEKVVSREDMVQDRLMLHFTSTPDLEILEAQGLVVQDTIKSLDMVLVDIPEGKTIEEIIPSLKEQGIFAMVEPEWVLYTAETTPDDSRFNRQWGMEKIEAEKAWDITTGSHEVIVGILDTGINYNHPDLAANIWTNEAEANGLPGVDDDNNGFIDDIHGQDFAYDDGDPIDDQGHGTHVAGIVGAVGNNSIGVTGVNWNVRLMAIKSGNAQGGFSGWDILHGTEYAIENGAKVINYSIQDYSAHTDETSPRWLNPSFQRALEKGVLIVCAAGNNGKRGSTHPGSSVVPNVMSIAATTSSDVKASYSQYGPNVHMAAPGSKIYSTYKNNYGNMNGTSMASPQVAGAAALLLSVDPDISVLDLKQRLMDTSDRLPALEGKVLSGRLNLYNLVNGYAPPNQAPIIDSFTPENPVSVEEGTDQVFSVSCSDPEDDTLYYTWELDGEEVGSDMSFYNYSPAKEDLGSHTLKVTVSDGNNNEASMAWQITVPNEYPVLSSFSPENPFEMTERDAQEFSVNVWEPDDQELSYTWKLDEEEVGDNADTFVYSPDSASSGEHKIEVTASDGHGGTLKHSWDVTVIDVNSGPVAEYQEVVLAEDSTKAITLTATDLDEDELTYLVVRDPTHGNLEGTPPKLSFIPNENFSGTDSFSFKVSDGKVWSEIATVAITVTPVNDLPIAKIEADPLSGHAPLTVNFDGRNSTDIDGTIVSYAWTIDSGSTLTDNFITHEFKDEGEYTVKLEVTDNDGGKSETSVTINVLAPIIDNKIVLVDTLKIDSRDPVGKYSNIILDAKKQYLIEVSGTVYGKNDKKGMTDAEYQTHDNWVTVTDGNTGAPWRGPDQADLQVDKKFIEWGAYNPEHIYKIKKAGNGEKVHFRFFDGKLNVPDPQPEIDWYTDNLGKFTVKIYLVKGKKSKAPPKPKKNK